MWSTRHSKSRRLRPKRDWRSMRDTWLLISFLGHSFVCFFQIDSQAVERAFPELAIFLDPFCGLLERLRVQLHFMNSSVAATPEKSRFFQHPYMFRDCWSRHGMRAGEMGNALI